MVNLVHAVAAGLATAVAARPAGLRAEPPVAAAACVPPSTASQVTSMDCATPGASLTVSFTPFNVYNGLGTVALKGTNPPLCFAVNGIIPDDGMPAIGLAPCDATGKDATQLFSNQGLNGEVISGLNGLCWDLESGVKAPNERLELFGCSGNANQARSAGLGSRCRDLRQRGRS